MNRNINNLKVQQLTSKLEIINILNEFNNDFTPPISKKVGNLDQYSNKLYNNAFVYAIISEKNLGFIAFYANDSIKKITYIPFIAVSKEARNNSIGSKLLSICHDKAKELGMRFIKLEVQNENKIAQNFYEKNGFYYLEEATDHSLYMVKEVK